tara:strand:- start:207 stop:542 length:336 start_codon:yes stop_codon:yes gene_type:complete
MFKTEDIIGDVVFISFKQTDQLKDLGINSSSGHYLIKGFDQLGLWLQHPGIILAQTEDNKGKPIPSNKIKKEQIDANFLVTWDNINTIMHYPDREGYDFPSEFDIEIGFKK